LEYLEHVARMVDARTVKKLLYGRPGGRRKKRRPSLKWTDDIGSDLINIL
jgi:hypothetical protein